MFQMKGQLDSDQDGQLVLIIGYEAARKIGQQRVYPRDRTELLRPGEFGRRTRGHLLSLGQKHFGFS